MNRIILTTLMAAIGNLGSAQMIGGINMEQTNKTEGSEKLLCDTTWVFETIQTWPAGLGINSSGSGDFFWVNGHGFSEIFKHDILGNVLDTLHYPTANIDGGGGLCHDGNFLWAMPEQDGNIYKIDPINDVVVDQFLAPYGTDSDPNNWGLAFDGTHLWNTRYSIGGTSQLFKIDISTGLAIDTITLGLPLVLGIEFINGQLYGVELSTDSIYLIDTNTGAFVMGYDWCLGYQLGVAFHPALGLYGVSSTIGSGGAQHVVEVENGITISVSQEETVRTPGIHLWPVPANSELWLEVDEEVKGYELYSNLGTLIAAKNFSGKRVRVDLKGIPSGSCIIKVATNSGQMIHRMFVIQ